MAGTVTASIVKNDTTSPTAFQNSTGTEIGKLARAWVRFTVSGTTPTITSSFNVSSVTYVTTGQFTITFTTAMANTSYTPVTGGSINTANNVFTYGVIFAQAGSPYYIAPTTTAMNVVWTNFAANHNPFIGTVAVFA